METGWETRTHNGTHKSNQTCAHSHTNVFFCSQRKTNHATHTCTQKANNLVPIPLPHPPPPQTHDKIQTRSHTIAFSIPRQTYKVKKKKHKNKLNNNFLPSLLLRPASLFHVVMFPLSLVLCSAEVVGAALRPPLRGTHVLTWAASQPPPCSERCGVRAWRSKGHEVPLLKVIPETALTCPFLVIESIRGPFMKTSGGISVRFCLNNSCSQVKNKKRMCLHVYAYLCAYSSGLCTGVCVCVWTVCVSVYIKSEMTRAELRLSSWSCRRWTAPAVPSLHPRPLIFPLAQPQFEPQRIHSIQVVSEQPLVSDKTQVLVQLQGWFVGDLSLQYNLGTHRRGWFRTLTQV